MELDLSGPAIARLKEEARALRQDQNWNGTPITQAQALEMVAHKHGARDWNTLRARAARPTRLTLGTRVAGRYLGQAFEGRVHAIGSLDQGRKMRLTVHLDAPVDVVKFDSFSSLLHRVRGVIGPDGRSHASTSDGQPHLVLESAEG